MSNKMDYENLPKAAQAAARRIARKTDQTPEEVARKSVRVLSGRGAEFGIIWGIE